jgi:hypothetical protein
MSYFDAMTNPYFKSAQDGRRLFFPWGILGHGYVVASQEDYERLRRRLGAFILIWLLLVVGTVAWNLDLGVIAIDLGVALYAIWAVYRIRSLNPSDQWQSLPRRILANSRFFMAFLWLIEFVLLACVGVYLFMLVAKPDDRLITVASAIFFGLCAVGLTRLLILWRRGTFTCSLEA